jgi:hypothetical protein
LYCGRFFIALKNSKSSPFEDEKELENFKKSPFFFLENLKDESIPTLQELVDKKLNISNGKSNILFVFPEKDYLSPVEFKYLYNLVISGIPVGWAKVFVSMLKETYKEEENII